MLNDCSLINTKFKDNCISGNPKHILQQFSFSSTVNNPQQFSRKLYNPTKLIQHSKHIFSPIHFSNGN